jgi:hypothetical protein
MTFDTQNAYVNDRKYNIKEFLENRELIKSILSGEENLKDLSGNILTYACGQKVSPYFRRCNPIPTPMTEWHLGWQNNFEEHTEIIHDNVGQIKSRRADVDLNENAVIEFQYSPISQKEVDERAHDYALCGKKIIWIVYGDNTIIVSNLTHSQRVFLEFTGEPWKYNAFVNTDFIYIDIESKLYKVYPIKVKSSMIDVSNPILKTEFIQKIKKNEELFEGYDVPQTRLYVKQMGAGNGKTYGIIQLIQDPNFKHYNTLLYLTKQHSAVHVIYSEINDQQGRGDLNGIEIIQYDHISKKHIIKFRNPPAKEERRIIIGTFDSFMHSLADKSCSGVNKFQAMIDSIIDTEELRCSKDGTIKFTNKGVKLNKRTLLIGDEMQDLPVNYAKAIFKIMRDRYVDFYAVGDKLQSISFKENAFTFLEEDPPETLVTRFTPVNICRRFNHPKLIEFVNKVIPFEKYKLPCISTNKSDIVDTENPLNIFKGQTVYANGTKDKKIEEEVEKLMYYYTREVVENNCQPNDFLIVNLFVKKNPLVEEFHLAIREFWKDKNEKKGNSETYVLTSYFHKSETGTSIDLSESDEATRIVSTHASKGDGRDIVFVIGFTEKGLKMYDGSENSLIYDSLLHVALTRMKKKLYLRYVDNSDDVCKKIKESGFDEICDFPPDFSINKNMYLEKLISKNYETLYNSFVEPIINKSRQQKINFESMDTQIIDTKHHDLRYGCMNLIALLCIYKQVSYEQKKHIFKVLENIVKSPIIYYSSRKKYYFALKTNNKKKEHEKTIPFYSYEDKKGDYHKYFKILRRGVTDVVIFLQRFLEDPEENNISDLSYINCIILHHLLEIRVRYEYTLFNVSDLYDFIHSYSHSQEDDKHKYKDEHYKLMNQVNLHFNSIYHRYKNLCYNYSQNVSLQGNTSFGLLQSFNIIGYDENTVLNLILKPQFNEMNYNECLVHSVCDTHLLKNSHKENNVFKKINGKNVVHCVCALNLEEPYLFEWNIDDNIDLIKNEFPLIQNTLHTLFVKMYLQDHDYILQFYKFYRFNEFNDPLKFINHFLDIYEKHVNSKETSRKFFPSYIKEFFITIKFLIKQKNIFKDKIKLLEMYDDDSYFLDTLHESLLESSEIFFGIECESSDD